MGLRRGFKTEANKYSKEFRAELDLKPSAPLSPWRLAEHLAIPLQKLSFFRDDAPEAIECLMSSEKESFFAITIFRENRRMIVYNDAHSKVRQTADIAHELAHAILGHSPSETFNKNGCRNFNESLESEANWLGPALLVSEEATMQIATLKTPIANAAIQYGVSEQLMRMRINVTGAMKRTRSWSKAS